MHRFEAFIVERAKGSEFEYLLRRAKAQDKEAIELLKNKELQKRLFTHINKRNRTPDQKLIAIFYRALAAIGILLFERLLNHLLKTKS